MAASPDFDVVVVGAGFGGLYTLHRLRARGLRVRVIEAGSGVGGTWYWNRYPGARCDVPSLEYCYSFSPELQREWRWTERYAAQPEILRYLDHVADRFDLRCDIQFDTRVESATWDEAARVWRVGTDTGDTLTGRHVIMATGNLSVARLPQWPGIESFAGAIYHTAAWPRDGVDFSGKRVGIVGTGSSGIQAIPEIAREAASLTVFQRTPSFAVPANNRPLTPEAIEAVTSNYDALWAAARASFLGFFGDPGPGSAIEAAETEREATYERAWNAGTTGLLQAYGDLLVNEESNATAADFARRKIQSLVKDPATAQRMTPQGYPIGARRLCSEIGYYETMNAPNVALVDLRETPIATVDTDGIRTAEKHYPLDMLVLATGFDAVTGALRAIDIRGVDGLNLRDDWADGPRSYLGLMIAGFPNLFMVTGPGSPSVLSNVVLSIEQHAEWIDECLGALGSRGATRIEATDAAEREWMEQAHDIAQTTLFPRANTWYQAKTRDGRQVFMPYVGGVGRYREICDAIARDGYRGFAIAGEEAGA